MKVAFHTLGCKVNQYETERMKEQFLSSGFSIVGEEEKADVYVINTCTVTNLADRKSRQYIRRMKKQSPLSIVAVTGCYSQVEPEELINMPEVDIVTGNGDKNNLIKLVQSYKEKSELDLKENREKIINIIPYENLTEYKDKGIITSMENRTRAYIKIQEGCNRFCSYCLIPYARGKVRSRDPEEIVLEAKTLVDKGFKEIVLTGINTALYGTETDFFDKFPIAKEILNRDERLRQKEMLSHDELFSRKEVLNQDKIVSEDNPSSELEEGAGMEYIIKKINDIPGEFRIRLSSLEPTVVNKDYVKRLMGYEKLCPHLHLSIQSGSDKVIARMNRHYTREDYLSIVKVLRDYDKGYGITTDIIVGFPGEEKEDFQDSLDMVEDVKFIKVHAFKYSRRKKTKAYDMKDQVSGEIKNERSNSLIAIGEKQAISFMTEQIGTSRTVLFEEVVLPENTTVTTRNELAKKTTETVVKSEVGEIAETKEKELSENLDSILISGYTENYIKVYAKGDESLLNELVKVKLTEIYLDGMKGEIENG